MADHNHGNNNDNGPPEPAHPQFPPLLQIEDIDSWLRLNGLRSAEDHDRSNNNQDWAQPEYAGFLSDLNRSESQAKHHAEEEYQQAIHTEIFREALQVEREEEQQRKRLLATWQEEALEIRSCYDHYQACGHQSDHHDSNMNNLSNADDTDHHDPVERERKAPKAVVWKVPLVPLAATCDTIFALASSRQRFASVGNRTGSTTPFKLTKEQPPLQLSLDEYPAPAIQAFLNLILHQASVHQLDADHVVDVCRLAHFLQCPRIVHATAQVLLDNVDSDNCLSLCQLADRLELPDLFERALFHMLKRLDDMEAHEAYETFSPELKTRIAGIRSVFATTTTNNHSTSTMPQHQDQTNNNSRPLYFTSLQEYLAIFAENVQYHRERLEEAKDENTRRFSSYAQSKIDKQEVRVLTLEAMLQEQKRLFGGKHNEQAQKPRQQQQDNHHP